MLREGELLSFVWCRGQRHGSMNFASLPLVGFVIIK